MTIYHVIAAVLLATLITYLIFYFAEKRAIKWYGEAMNLDATGLAKGDFLEKCQYESEINGLRFEDEDCLILIGECDMGKLSAHYFVFEFNKTGENGPNMLRYRVRRRTDFERQIYKKFQEVV